jgi:hypothetical protein
VVLAVGANPVAQLDALAVSYRPAFDLLISGSGFVEGAVVEVGGVAKPTTFVNEYVVSALVNQSDLQRGGLVRVTNPSSPASNELVLRPQPMVYLPLLRR